MKDERLHVEAALVGAAISGYYSPAEVLGGGWTPEDYRGPLAKAARIVWDIAAKGEVPSALRLSEAGVGSALIAEAIQAHHTLGGHPVDYGFRLRQLAEAERVAEGAKRLLSLALEGGNYLEALQELYDKALRGSPLKDRPKTLEELYLEYEASLDRGEEGPLFSTGFINLDSLVQFYEGQVVTIGARTSAGKTAFAVHLALRAAEAGHKVLYFSTEMTPEQIMLRALSQRAGIPIRNLMYGGVTLREELRKKKALEKLRGLPFSVVYTSSAEEVMARTARALVMGEAKVIFVDFLQDLRYRGSMDNYRLLIGGFVKGMKNLALTHRGLVFTVAQLNRGAVALSKKDEPPALHHLKESGNIEESSDTVLLLWRKRNQDGVYGEEAEVLVAKQRNGALGSVPLIFAGPVVSFVDPLSAPLRSTHLG